jgi:hypothetical protein
MRQGGSLWRRVCRSETFRIASLMVGAPIMPLGITLAILFNRAAREDDTVADERYTEHCTPEGWLVKRFWRPPITRAILVIGVSAFALSAVLDAATGHGWLGELFGPIHYMK